MRRLRRAAALVSRAGGALMVLAGAYVAWYGWYEIRAFPGGTGDDPIVDTAATIQSAVAGWLDRLGPTAVAVAVAVLLAVTATAAALARGRRIRR